MSKRYYQIKNAIKYFFKRNLSTAELWKCASLQSSGYMNWKTYERIIKRECGVEEVI